MPENPEVIRILKVGISTFLALGSLTLGNRVIFGSESPIENVPHNDGHALAVECIGPMVTASGCITVVTEAVTTTTEPEPTTSVPATEVPATTTTRMMKPEPVTTLSTAPVRRATTIPPQTNEAAATGNNLGVFESTCYSLEGTTASGRPVGPGIVAVDPRVIPLGTRLMVEGYGSAIAADTGGAIKGRTIDVWKPTDSECYDWGRQSVHVSIIG